MIKKIKPNVQLAELNYQFNISMNAEGSIPERKISS